MSAAAPSALTQLPSAEDAGLDAGTRTWRGWRHWVASYGRMFRFETASQRAVLPTMVVMQLLMGLATAIIFGLYVPRLPHLSALYITTGAPTLALIPVGMVMMPVVVAQQRHLGTYDFVWSLPVPRSAAAAATLSLFTLIAVPGMVATVVLAALRYHVSLHPTLALAPAVILVALMSASVGFGLAHAVKNPMVANLFSNLLIFMATLFTPIAFPASHYPHWLVGVHEFLPLYPMATVLRDGLVPGLAGGAARSFVVLAAWTVVAWSTAAWTVGRRG